MTQENKDRLLGLLQQHKELGIAEQIDFDKSMTDSLIANSVALVDFLIVFPFFSIFAQHKAYIKF